MDIAIDNLSYVKGKRIFLKGVNATICKNKVTVVVGRSGSGKSTLLALIGKRDIGGTKSGNISYINEISNNRRVAHCPSADMHIEYFTVMQELYYSCLLRNSHRLMSENKCTQDCLAAASAVGLEKSLNRVVGSNFVKGCSRGERRLLSIAIELLGTPLALCLDEPMSGLDAEAAVRVAGVLTSIAVRQSKTILCSLHYPSQEMLYQSNWHNILFLNAGQVVYYGRISSLGTYLSALAMYSFIPSEFKPSAVEFTLDLLGKDKGASYTLSEAWQTAPDKMHWLDMSNPPRQSRELESSRITCDTKRIVTEAEDGSESHSVLYEIALVSLRHFMYKVHAREGGYRTVIGRYILGGILFGVTFHNTGRDMEDQRSVFEFQEANFFDASYNMMSIEFCMCCFIVVSCCLPIPEMYHMREYFERESRSKLYRPLARWCSIITVDIPSLIIGAVLFTWIVILMVKPMGDYVLYYALVVLSTLISFGYAYLCVELTRSVEMATVLYGMSIALSIWFAGFSQKRPNMLHWLRWGCDLDYLYYTIGQLMVNEFRHFNEDSRSGDQGEKILDYYAYQNLNRKECITNLFINLGVVLIAVLVAVYIPHNAARVQTVADIREILKSVDSTDAKQNSIKGAKCNAKIDRTSLDIDKQEELSLGASLLTTEEELSMHSQIAELPAHLVPDISLRHSSTYNSTGPHGTHTRTSMPSVERFSSCDHDPGHANAFILPPARRVTLRFQNLSYVIKPSLMQKLCGPKDGREDKIILNDITGTVHPGELWAVIGANGAGKTSLLNVLAGRSIAGKVYGNITVNGLHFNGIGNANSTDATSPSFGFVPHTDILCDVLTVYETLEFAAMLRMRQTDRAQVKGAVERVLRILDLASVADCFVGSEAEPVLSGSEMRRVAIGCELINMASVLFCLDPVYALDPYLSVTVIDALLSLTKSFHTVICTLQHPSAIVFSKFDKVMLVHAGHLVYSGPAALCASYIQEHCLTIAEALPDETNPVEYVLKIMADLPMDDESSAGGPTVAKLVQLTHLHATDSSLPEEYTYAEANKGWWEGVFVDFGSLLHVQVQREVLQESRRIRYWLACVVRSMFLGSVLGIVFYQQPRGEIYARIACLLQVYVVGCVWMMEILPELHMDKLRFIHEREVHATNTITACLSSGLPMSAILLVESMAFGLPVYLFGGYRDGVLHIIIYLMVLFLSMLLNMYAAQLICLVTPSPRTSIVAYSGVVGLQSFYCGYSVLIPTLGWWFRWAAISNPATFAMNAWYWNEFRNNDFALDGVNYNKYAEMFGWTTNLVNSFAYLILIAALHKVGCFLAMKGLTSRYL